MTCDGPVRHRHRRADIRIVVWHIAFNYRESYVCRAYLLLSLQVHGALALLINQ